ncbi:ribosome maturation factor RimP [Desulfosporosinus sp. BICA1-9]|uniref:ribosome maturation factor RimP n=1 Tax=Desulfosporosinus sp. BICA1-9 TaxID=1531958 RepID=UPI00054C114C|nr:ribosome maturation factor RimP [Desulfosporosinus sp. BICA1-9]KJS45930.1 MAG: ribosome maturation factor RimP [Peptococcaceae bacterium BRH_c23]KJS85744.1 MAG: ribosome maturation factor RimP [Desulfosporosinus sp. BICA1-9]
MNKSIVQEIEILVEPLVLEKGLELVSVEYIKEGAHWYLRLYIDKEGGVDMDDCTNVSHAVSEMLDIKNTIPQAYMLEVSSPGLERPLKKEEDFIRFQGSLIMVHTISPFQGFKKFSGNLVGLINDEIVLEYEGKRVSIPRTLVKKTHLLLDF